MAIEIMDRAFNEKAGLLFPCLIRILSEHFKVPLGCYFDHRTTITKSTNATLIKDVNNPLYKAKSAWTTLLVTITLGQPPTVLSFEGTLTATPTNQLAGVATE